MSLGKNQIVSLIAGAFVGLGVSVMWPGILSLCSARFPTGSTAMFALLAMFGDFGCSFGPWMTGMVADRYNLNTGFLIATAFPLLMFIILIFMNKNKEKKK
jgi:fucose permease